MRGVKLKDIIKDVLVSFLLIGLLVLILIIVGFVSVPWVIQILASGAQWIILLFLGLVIVDYIRLNCG